MKSFAFLRHTYHSSLYYKIGFDSLLTIHYIDLGLRKENIIYIPNSMENFKAVV